MSATEDTAAQHAANPATPPEHLAWIAANRSDLRAALAANPSTYPDLLQWLSQLGDPEVQAALARRGATTTAGTQAVPAGAPAQAPGDAWYRQQTPGGAAHQPVRLPRWGRNVLIGVAGAAVIGVGGWLLVTQVLFPRGAGSPQEAVTDLAGAMAEGDAVGSWLLLAPDEVGGLKDALMSAGERAQSLELTGDTGQYAFSNLTTSVATVSDDRAQVTITGGTLTVAAARGESGARARALAGRAAGEDGTDENRTEQTFDLAEVGEDIDGGLQLTVVKQGRRWYVSPLLTVSTLVSRSQGSSDRVLTVDDLQRTSATPEEAIANTVEAIGRQDVPGIAGALSEAEGVPLLEMSSAVTSELDSSIEAVDVELDGQSVDRQGDRAVVTVQGLSATDSDGTVSGLTYSDGCVTADGEQECAPEKYRPLLPDELEIVTVRGDDGMWGVSVLGTLGLAAQEALQASDADLLLAMDLQETVEPSATLDSSGTATVRRGGQEYVTVDVRKGEGPLAVVTGLKAGNDQYVGIYTLDDGVPVPVESGVQYSDTGFVLLGQASGDYRVLVQPDGDAALPDEFTLTGAQPKAGSLASGENLTTDLSAGDAFVYDVAAGWLTGNVTTGSGYQPASVWSNDGTVWLGEFGGESTTVQVPAEGAKLFFGPVVDTAAVALSLGGQPPFGFDLNNGGISPSVDVTPNYSSTYTLSGPAGLSYVITATPSDGSSISLVVDGDYGSQTNSDGAEVYTGAYNSSGSISVKVLGGGLFSSPGPVTLTATIMPPEGD